MSIADDIKKEMYLLHNEKMASHLSRFFKTGEGEYGEGDKFLGIKVPVTRLIVKKYYKKISLEDIDELINSEWHEIRLAAFLFLIELYKKTIKELRFDKSKIIIDYYIANIRKGNNWDLVDLVSPYILGDWILRNPEEEKILYIFAGKVDSLWHQRVAIVSTLPLIKAGNFKPIFKLSETLIKNKHDLIHKASGWMLREVGKRGGKPLLIKFLYDHKNDMPRTMLRYAIEKFPEFERRELLKK